MNKMADLRLVGFLGSAFDISGEFYDFAHWALDNKLKLHKVIQIKDYNDVGMGYGICSKEDIKQGEKIFSFPIFKALSSFDFVLSP